MQNNGLYESIEYWKDLVEDFFDTGLAPKEYCKKNDIPIRTLSTWRNRYKKQFGLYNPHRFKELAFEPTPKIDRDIKSTSSGVHIYFSETIKIELDSDFDEVVFSKIAPLIKDLVC
jgi:hypothetical protein